MQIDAAGAVVAFTVKPVGSGDFGQLHRSEKLLEPVRRLIRTAPDLYLYTLTTLGLAIQQKGGPAGFDYVAGKKKRLSGQGKSRFCSEPSKKNTLHKHENSGEEKGRKGTVLLPDETDNPARPQQNADREQPSTSRIENTKHRRTEKENQPDPTQRPPNDPSIFLEGRAALSFVRFVICPHVLFVLCPKLGTAYRLMPAAQQLLPLFLFHLWQILFLRFPGALNLVKTIPHADRKTRQKRRA